MYSMRNASTLGIAGYTSSFSHATPWGRGYGLYRVYRTHQGNLPTANYSGPEPIWTFPLIHLCLCQSRAVFALSINYSPKSKWKQGRSFHKGWTCHPCYPPYNYPVCRGRASDWIVDPFHPYPAASVHKHIFILTPSGSPRSKGDVHHRLFHSQALELGDLLIKTVGKRGQIWFLCSGQSATSEGRISNFRSHFKSVDILVSTGPTGTRVQVFRRTSVTLSDMTFVCKLCCRCLV